MRFLALADEAPPVEATELVALNSASNGKGSAKSIAPGLKEV
jgi:hypothetical protein